MSVENWGLLFTGLSSVATLVLALTALQQGFRIKKQDKILAEQGKRIEQQIELGNEQARIAHLQADSARESVEITERLYKESVRSRIDQDAPEIQILMAHPEPPLIDELRSGMPQHDELRLLDGESFDRATPAFGREFVFEQDRNVFLWFYGRGLLINEGNRSARVRLSGETRYASGVFEPWSDKVIDLPMLEPGVSDRVAILGPGERALFEWAAGHSLEDWALAHEKGWPPQPQGTIWIDITTFDNRQMGVIDTQWLQFNPDVLTPVAGRAGHWKVTGPINSSTIGALPRVRSYRHEGAVGEDISQVQQFHETGHVD